MSQKVLIVDDSKLARMAAAKALKTLHADWIPLEAASADEALVRAKEELPDFALLDYNMPGKDGISLASELLRLDSRLSVAVVSANHQAEVVERTRAAGATFIGKPLTEKALSDYLNAAIPRPQATPK